MRKNTAPEKQIMEAPATPPPPPLPVEIIKRGVGGWKEEAQASGPVD